MNQGYYSAVKNYVIRLRSIIKSETIEFNSVSSELTIIKGRLVFIDCSVLEFRELIAAGEHDYRFHWMDKETKLISRWDTAPHHRQLDNFPFHLHLPDKIESSSEINLIKVLNIIKKTIISSRLS